MLASLVLLALSGCLPALPPTDTDTDTDSPVDVDADGYTSDVDCDDGDAAIHPDALEVCDDADNDCDGETDPSTSTDAASWYLDADEDTFGTSTSSVTACAQVDGYVANADDCNDGDDSIHPGVEETCDTVDADCNGLIDDTTTCFDDDGDGYTEEDGDCDDASALSSPDVVDACDGVDHDCDGIVDEDDSSDAAEWHADSDGDSFGDPDTLATACTQPSNWVADDTDCADSNPDAYPGAPEYCDAGDTNCDSLTNQADSVDAAVWYSDSDHDGYGDSTVTVTACSDPTGYVANAADCDDSNSAQTGPTTWYTDADEDGYGVDTVAAVSCTAPASSADTPGDCDDTEAMTSPGAVEICEDGVDNDCDGGSGTCAPASESLSGAVQYTGETWNDRAGFSVAGVGDVDEDGYDDMLIGAHYANDEAGSDVGAAYLVLGSASPTSSSLADAVKYTGGGAGDFAGISVAGAGDVNGDGRADLLVGASGNGDGGLNSGAAFLVLGTTTPTSALLSTAIEYPGESASDNSGRSVAGAGDVNADGYADMLIGSWRSDAGGLNAGAAHLVLGGSAPASASLSTAVRYTGESTGDQAGFSSAGVGDVDGDGFDDVAIGAIGVGSGAGAAYLVLGGPPASVSLSTAQEYAGAGSDEAGYSVAGAGDVDGDGYVDWLVGAVWGGSEAGAAYLLLGGPSPASAALSTAVSYSGAASGDWAGSSVGGPGDVDGDGYADMLVGAVYNSDGGSEAGAVYLLLGASFPASGSLAASTQFTGEFAGDEAGGALAGAGDVDGDGFPDMLIGAPGELGSLVGAAYLVLGTGM